MSIETIITVALAGVIGGTLTILRIVIGLALRWGRRTSDDAARSGPVQVSSVPDAGRGRPLGDLARRCSPAVEKCLLRLHEAVRWGAGLGARCILWGSRRGRHLALLAGLALRRRARAWGPIARRRSGDLASCVRAAAAWIVSWIVRTTPVTAGRAVRRLRRAAAVSAIALLSVASAAGRSIQATVMYGVALLAAGGGEGLRRLRRLREPPAVLERVTRFEDEAGEPPRPSAGVSRGRLAAGRRKGRAGGGGRRRPTPSPVKGGRPPGDPQSARPGF